MNQKNRGIILSYVNLLMGMAVNLCFTPALIVALGEVDYSLYKVMQSFAGPLSVFQLGISTVVTRSIVRAKIQMRIQRQTKRIPLPFL
jgi:O-antigen/teichoic acid export membrane protein